MKYSHENVEMIMVGGKKVYVIYLMALKSIMILMILLEPPTNMMESLVGMILITI